MSKRVVITGAAGNLGGKLRHHLEAAGGYELVLLDLDPRDDPAIVRADLGEYDVAWVGLLQGAQAVVHLAANPDAKAAWADLERPNVDGAINLFAAAVAVGVPRVVFASTNRTMDGYRDTGKRITPDLPARPDEYYAASKLMGERLGQHHADRHGLSVVCLRIGSIRRGENPFEDIRGVWEQKKWLSNRDWCQAAEKAIEAEGVTFAVLNLMSEIAGSQWDLSKTKEVLGYDPQDL